MIDSSIGTNTIGIYGDGIENKNYGMCLKIAENWRLNAVIS